MSNRDFLKLPGGRTLSSRPKPKTLGGDDGHFNNTRIFASDPDFPRPGMGTMGRNKVRLPVSSMADALTHSGLRSKIQSHGHGKKGEGVDLRMHSEAEGLGEDSDPYKHILTAECPRDLFFAQPSATFMRVTRKIRDYRHKESQKKIKDILKQRKQDREEEDEDLMAAKTRKELDERVISKLKPLVSVRMDREKADREAQAAIVQRQQEYEAKRVAAAEAQAASTAAQSPMPTNASAKDRDGTKGTSGGLARQSSASGDGKNSPDLTRQNSSTSRRSSVSAIGRLSRQNSMVKAMQRKSSTATSDIAMAAAAAAAIVTKGRKGDDGNGTDHDPGEDSEADAGTSEGRDEHGKEPGDATGNEGKLDASGSGQGGDNESSLGGQGQGLAIDIPSPNGQALPKVVAADANAKPASGIPGTSALANAAKHAIINKVLGQFSSKSLSPLPPTPGTPDAMTPSKGAMLLARMKQNFSRARNDKSKSGSMKTLEATQIWTNEGSETVQRARQIVDYYTAVKILESLGEREVSPEFLQKLLSDPASVGVFDEIPDNADGVLAELPTSALSQGVLDYAVAVTTINQNAKEDISEGFGAPYLTHGGGGPGDPFRMTEAAARKEFQEQAAVFLKEKEERRQQKKLAKARERAARKEEEKERRNGGTGSSALPPKLQSSSTGSGSLKHPRLTAVGKELSDTGSPTHHSSGDMSGLAGRHGVSPSNSTSAKSSTSSPASRHGAMANVSPLPSRTADPLARVHIGSPEVYANRGSNVLKDYGLHDGFMDPMSPESAATLKRFNEILNKSVDKFGMKRSDAQELIMPSFVIPKGHVLRMNKSKLVMRCFGVSGHDLAAEQVALHKLHIKELDMSSNRLGVANGIKYLVPCLQKRELAEIKLDENMLRGSCIETLVRALKGTRRLKSLSLGKNCIRDQGVAALCRFLNDNVSLEKLNISSNKIGPKGGTELAGALSKNYTLLKLNLSWNEVRGEGAHLLCESLCTNEGLKSLDLGWNGLGVEGANMLADSLTINTTLEKLNIANNRFDDVSGMLIAYGLRRNKTLYKLNINGNPLGQNGGQCIIRHNKIVGGDIRVITMTGCNITSGANMSTFDVSNPNGFYTLDLSKPAERAVASELWELSTKREGEENWLGETLDYKEFDCPEDLTNPWTIPRKGVLRLEFYSKPVLPKLDEAMNDEEFGDMLGRLEMRESSADKKDYILSSAQENFFKAEHVGQLMVQVDESSARVEVSAKIFSRIVDLENVRAKFVSLLHKKEQDRVSRVLGKLFQFNPRFPNGRWKLELAAEYDWVLGQKLQQLGNEICNSRRLEEAVDTSQLQNYEVIRNAKLDGRAFKYHGAFQIPRKGIIEFDFAAPLRPNSNALPISGTDFKKFIERELPKLRLEPTETLGEVISLKVQSYSGITAEQFVQVVKEVHGSDILISELVLRCFQCVLDIDNLWEQLKANFSKACLQMIVDQCGWLNVFNPMHVEGHYKLNLMVPDERRVAEILVDLAIREPGENWRVSMYNGLGFELTQRWVEEVPKRGVLDLEYMCLPPDQRPRVRRRHVNICLASEAAERGDDDFLGGIVVPLAELLLGTEPVVNETWHDLEDVDNGQILIDAWRGRAKAPKRPKPVTLGEDGEPIEGEGVLSEESDAESSAAPSSEFSSRPTSSLANSRPGTRSGSRPGTRGSVPGRPGTASDDGPGWGFRPSTAEKNEKRVRGLLLQENWTVVDDSGDIENLSSAPVLNKHHTTFAVRILEAADLIAADDTGTSDPYVQIHLQVDGETMVQQDTDVVPETLDPVWDETKYFSLPAKTDLLKVNLKIEVFDKDF